MPRLPIVFAYPFAEVSKLKNIGSKILALLASTGLIVPAVADELSSHIVIRGFIGGIASVVDGDGLSFGNQEVRLQGIAAPEWRSNRRDLGGKEAADNLRRLSAGRYVRCALDGTTTRGRPVGVCFLDARNLTLKQIRSGEGIDLGQAQVEAGHALDCPRFSQGRYAAAERRARAAGYDLAAIYQLPSYCDPR